MFLALWWLVMSYSKRQLEAQAYKGKKESGFMSIGREAYSMYPQDYCRHASIVLSSNSVRILNLLISKLRGEQKRGKYITNNGDLSITHKELTEKYSIGISPNSFYNSIKEMIDKGFVIKTRQGGKNMCSLYALTFMKIGDIRDKDGKRKIDYPPTETPSNDWRTIAIQNKQYFPINDNQI